MNFSNYAGQNNPPVSNIQNDGQDAETVYTISQHYHHSAHLVKAASEVSLSDTASYSVPPERPSSIYDLTQSGIAPTSLLRSQITLFEQSTQEQQARLLDLWRLAPPNYAANGGQELADRLGEYQVMTLEQEEELALLRYQKHMEKEEDPDSSVNVDQAVSSDSPFSREVG